MNFPKISMLPEGPYKEIMKDFLQFKKKILKQLDTWEKMILKRFDQGIEQFSITKVVYPCIEPTIDLDKFYNCFQNKLKTKQNVLQWEQIIDVSLKQFQKKMQEMYEITLQHFNQPKIINPNLIHYNFHSQIAISTLKLEQNRITRVNKPNGKWELAFLQPQLDFSIEIFNNENSLTLQIIHGEQSIIGVACPSEFQMARFEYPERNVDFYSISSQGYIETVVWAEQKEESVFQYKPLDIVSVKADKQLKKLIFTNLTTNTVEMLSFYPKLYQKYHFFVGLRQKNEEVVIHTLE